jgi:hypothetical protein
MLTKGRRCNRSPERAQLSALRWNKNYGCPLLGQDRPFVRSPLCAISGRSSGGERFFQPIKFDSFCCEKLFQAQTRPALSIWLRASTKAPLSLFRTEIILEQRCLC